MNSLLLGFCSTLKKVTILAVTWQELQKLLKAFLIRKTKKRSKEQLMKSSFMILLTFTEKSEEMISNKRQRDSIRLCAVTRAPREGSLRLHPLRHRATPQKFSGGIFEEAFQPFYESAEFFIPPIFFAPFVCRFFRVRFLPPPYNDVVQ